LKKNNYQQQHEEKAIQQIPPPLDNGKTRATEEKTMLNNSNNNCFLTFSFLSLFFSFSKKYSLATWSTSCSTDYSNIEYAL